MTPVELIALAEITKDSLVAAYESDAKSDASALAKSLAALVAAVAAQVGQEQTVAFKVA